MKQFVIVLFALLCMHAAQAQKKGSGVEFGFALDAGVPVGNDLNPFTTAGFGGDATLGYNFDSKFAVLMRGGYMAFLTTEAYRSYNINTINNGFIKAVGRYTFYRNLFIEPQLGYTHFSSATGGRNKINSDGLGYAFAAGTSFGPLKAFDISLRYEGATCQNGINFVALRLAYSLKPGTYF